MFPYITLLNVKAPEVTYNALVSAFSAPDLDKTQYQQSLLSLSEHNSTLFVMTHDRRTIGKMQFMIWQSFYQLFHGLLVNRGQV